MQVNIYMQVARGVKCSEEVCGLEIYYGMLCVIVPGVVATNAKHWHLLCFRTHLLRVMKEELGEVPLEGSVKALIDGGLEAILYPDFEYGGDGVFVERMNRTRVRVKSFTLDLEEVIQT